MHEYKVKEFRKIESNLIDIFLEYPDNVVKDFSPDQQLLFDYVVSIHNGKLEENVAIRKAGKSNDKLLYQNCLDL